MLPASEAPRAATGLAGEFPATGHPGKKFFPKKFAGVGEFESRPVPIFKGTQIPGINPIKYLQPCLYYWRHEKSHKL